MQELTRQQNKIVELLAEGYNNSEIADELKISLHTAKNYITHIKKRLNTRNRTEIVILFYKQKIEQLEKGDNLCTAKYAEEEMQRGTI